MDEPVVRILIVDEDRAARAFFEPALQQEFGRVEIDLVSGAETLAHAAPQDCHAAIVSSGPSWPDSLSVLADLRKRDPLIPVILLLTPTDADVAPKALHAGFDSCVVRSGAYLDLLCAKAKSAAARCQQQRAARDLQFALRESQSFLEQAQDMGGMGSWVSGLGDDRSIWWSRQTYRLFGIAEGTVVDVDAFFGIVHPDDRQAVRDAVANAIANRTPYSINHRIVRPDGEQRWVFERAEVVFDPAGNPLRLIGVVQDVTERVQRDLSVQGEKELLEKIIDSLPGAFYIAEESGKFLRWNKYLQHVTGYSPQEMQQLQLRTLIPPEDAERNASLRKEALRAGSLQTDATLVSKDGTRTPFHWTIRVVDFDGRRCAIGTGIEISERKRAEEELRLLKSIALGVSEETSDLRSALEVVLRKICDVTGWMVGEAWLPNEADTALEFSDASYTLDPTFQDFVQAHRGIKFPYGHGLVGTVWEQKKAVCLPDLASPIFLHKKIAIDAGLNAGLGIPVLAGDAVVAVLSFFMREARADDQRMMEIVAGAAAQLGLVVQRKRMELRLQHLAHFDGLTGLPNRSLFNDRLQQTLIEASRHRRLVGVAVLDVDRFKNINETLGHDAGDELIKAVSARLTETLRGGDTIARFSGDEFAIVLADIAQADDAARLVRKILDVFLSPFTVGTREIYVTASLGVALYPMDDAEAAGLMRNAEVAMYRAKDLGRNTFQFYSADMGSRASDDLALENDLRHAIERNELVLNYQPLVESRTGRILGLEALVRWNHPVRGMIPPVQFIPLAEESGLIVPIGEWVLRTACQQCQLWRIAGFPSLRVAVNLSARQFREQGLDLLVMRSLRDMALDPSALELELTESIIMQSSHDTLTVMQRLSEMGVTFSIDDFGTGYSNLAYLKRFPVDVLKVDRSFVKDIPDDLDDAAIADAIITMAHSLGMHVIAEGVETEQQRVFMRSHGCDAMQGYFFSKPLPVEEISQLLKRQSPLPLAKKSA